MTAKADPTREFIVQGERRHLTTADVVALRKRGIPAREVGTEVGPLAPVTKPTRVGAAGQVARGVLPDTDDDDLEPAEDTGGITPLSDVLTPPADTPADTEGSPKP